MNRIILLALMAISSLASAQVVPQKASAKQDTTVTISEATIKRIRALQERQKQDQSEIESTLKTTIETKFELDKVDLQKTVFDLAGGKIRVKILPAAQTPVTPQSPPPKKE